jgi:hypothetical protein
MSSTTERSPVGLEANRPRGKLGESQGDSPNGTIVVREADRP